MTLARRRVADVPATPAEARGTVRIAQDECITTGYRLGRYTSSGPPARGRFEASRPMPDVPPAWRNQSKQPDAVASCPSCLTDTGPDPELSVLSPAISRA